MAITGSITTAKAEPNSSHTLTVSTSDGSATINVRASKELIAKMRAETLTIRVAGKVSSVIYDDANGQVGLKVVGDNGSTVEWVTPEMSDAEEAARDAAEQAEQDAVEAEKRDAEAAEFKAQILNVIATDNANREVEFKQRVTDLIAVDADARAAELQQLVTDQLNSQASQFKQNVLDLINNDADVREAIKAAAV